jgi:hypothetical protein
MRRKSPYDYCVLATKANLIWLGPIVTNNATKTQWQCNLGHVWETAYENIRSGCGCPYCYKENVRSYLNHYTEENYHELAHSKGFRWVGKFVETTRTLTSWECDCGYKWQAAYNEIQQGKGNGGRGCPRCTKSRRKITIDDYKVLAQAKGYKWLSSEIPQSVDLNTKWECNQGHVFQMRYIAMSRGQGCPICSNSNLPKSPTDYHSLASKIGYQFLGDVPHNNKVKTKWICSNGHLWEASYSALLNGNRCPRCRNLVNGVMVSKPQLAIGKILNGEINYKVKRYAIDVALLSNNQKIAIEYDAAFFHDVAHDNKRDNYLIAQGWHILRIKSGILIPTFEQLNKAIDYLMNGNTYTEIILPDWRGEK